MKQRVVAAIAALVMLGLPLAMAQSATASPNTSPSTAIEVTPGLPFSGSWPGTPLLDLNDCCDYRHWYRPTVGLRSGDTMQLAVDATQDYGFELCLASPTDDFSATEVVRRECANGTQITGPGLSRHQLVYQRSQPGGFLVVTKGIPDDVTVYGSYTMTIERIITRVNIGFVPPARPGLRLSIRAALRYGDNTPVADGIGAQLQYRWKPARPGVRVPFKTIGRGASRGGNVVLRGRLPRASSSMVTQLRACVDQPGGTVPRCTRAYRVRVRG